MDRFGIMSIQSEEQTLNLCLLGLKVPKNKRQNLNLMNLFPRETINIKENSLITKLKINLRPQTIQLASFQQETFGK